MTTLTINVDTETEQQFRKTAEKEYKGKKGYLGDAISEAMKKWLEERRQQKIAAEALADLRKGWKFGKILYKTREELHAR